MFLFFSSLHSPMILSLFLFFSFLVSKEKVEKSFRAKYFPLQQDESEKEEANKRAEKKKMLKQVHSLLLNKLKEWLSNRINYLRFPMRFTIANFTYNCQWLRFLFHAFFLLFFIPRIASPPSTTLVLFHVSSVFSSFASRSNYLEIK